MSLKGLIGDYLRCNTNDADAREEIVLEISQAIELQKHTLLDLVSNLGDYLVESDATLRSKAMQLLQHVLSTVPIDNLSGQHITVMTQFFCDRLSDDVCLSQSLAALISISKMNRFAEEDAQKTVRAVFAISDDSHQHPQRTRFQLYTLFDGIMARKRKALRAISSEFITGFTNLMSGEKDPRNLMLAFSILRVVLQEFDIVSQVTDLFDVVYCYFPITFRPPPEDPTSITTDDLKARLRDCLCATHQFAPYLIPALIEKLNAVAVSVKKDTIQTISACCKTYSARTLDTYTSQLWAAIKFEIIQSEEGILEEIALTCLTDITACLSRGLTEMPKQGVLSRWLQPIVMESIAQLKEPELKSAKPCGKILRSVSVASPICLSVVVQSVMPGLLAICDEAANPNSQASLLEVLNNVLEAVLVVQESDKQEISSLAFVKDDLLTQLSKGLVGAPTNEVELRKAALAGLMKLSQITSLLDDKEQRRIIGYLTDLILDEEGEVSDEALLALSQFSEYKSSLILEYTFPVLLARLPSEEHQTEITTAGPILNALAQLSRTKIVFDTLIVRLLSRLDSSLMAQPSEIAYPKLLLSTIRQVLRQYSNDATKDESAFYSKLVPQIFQRTISNPQSLLLEPHLLDITSEIVNILTRACDVEAQRAIAADIFSLYLTGGINGLVTHIPSNFKPFSSETSDAYQLNTITLFVAVFAGLRPSIDIVGSMNVDFLVTAVNLISKCNHESQRTSLLRLTALILNKCRSDADITAVVAHISSQSGFTSSENLSTLLWITKALVLRSHRNSKDMLQSVMQHLTDDSHGKATAQGFQIIIGEDELISKVNHCVIRPLHKQKFYASAIPLLKSGLAEAAQGTYMSIDARKKLTCSAYKVNYLIALSIVIANVPKNIYIPEISSLMPILLQCISLDDPNIKTGTIKTIEATGIEAKDAVALHLSTLVPLLLSATKLDVTNPPVSLSKGLY